LTIPASLSFHGAAQLRRLLHKYRFDSCRAGLKTGSILLYVLWPEQKRSDDLSRHVLKEAGAAKFWATSFFKNANAQGALSRQ